MNELCYTLLSDSEKIKCLNDFMYYDTIELGIVMGVLVVIGAIFAYVMCREL